MTNEEKFLAQKLLEMFQSFPKLHRYQCPIPGLKPSELMLLLHIRQAVLTNEFGMKVSDISKSLMVASPTVTQLVNSLEKQGLLERSVDQGDRRVVRIRITAKGEKIMQGVEADFLHHSMGLVRYLGMEKTRDLIEIMSQIGIYFSEVYEPAIHDPHNI